MEERIKELYYLELSTQRLHQEVHADYIRDEKPVDEEFEKLYSILSHQECEQFRNDVWSLMDTANCICFSHGFRLGLRLAAWVLKS